MASTAAPVCPRCGPLDAIRKVSAIVQGVSRLRATKSVSSEPPKPAMASLFQVRDASYLSVKCRHICTSSSPTKLPRQE